MEGIEILSQTAIMENPPWFGVLIVVSIVSMFVCFVITFVTIVTDSSETVPLIFGILGCLFFVEILILGANNFFEKPTGRYEYKALISEHVSYTEFCEKYEVVDQDGKIWIIRDKE